MESCSCRGFCWVWPLGLSWADHSSRLSHSPSWVLAAVPSSNMTFSISSFTSLVWLWGRHAPGVHRASSCACMLARGTLVTHPTVSRRTLLFSCLAQVCRGVGALVYPGVIFKAFYNSLGFGFLVYFSLFSSKLGVSILHFFFFLFLIWYHEQKRGSDVFLLLLVTRNSTFCISVVIWCYSEIFSLP